MSRETLIALLDHGPTAFVAVLIPTAGVLALFLDKPEVAGALGIVGGVYGGTKALSGVASGLKRGKGKEGGDA